MASKLGEVVKKIVISLVSLMTSALEAILLYLAGSIIPSILYTVEFIHSSRDRPPVKGTVFDLLNRFHRLFDYEAEIAGSHSTFRILRPGRSDIFTADPANVEHMLKTSFHMYSKGKDSYEVMVDLFGDGIFAVDGEKWRHQRKMASSEFSTKILGDYGSSIFRLNAGKIVRNISPLANSIQPINMQDVFMKSTMDSFFKLGFGMDLGMLSAGEGGDAMGARFSKAFDDANYIVFHRFADLFWKLKRFFNIGLECELKRNIKIIDHFVYQLIHTKREQIKSTTSTTSSHKSKEDILWRFIIASEEEPEKITDKYLRDIILNFLFAGKDTSANTLTWFFYMLCKHPTIQEKIAAEIEEATREGCCTDIADDVDGIGLRITYQALDRMQYLHAALTETLRLYPAVSTDGRYADEDDVLPDGFRVKRGEVLYYTGYSMGRSKKLWGDDAEEFRPERWIHNGSFRPESSFKFVAFHGGPRICIGKEFAYRQMKILATFLLHFFRFKLVDESKSAAYKTMFTLQMDKGLLLYAAHRRPLKL